MKNEVAKEQPESGWEIAVPTFLTNPFVWIAIVAVIAFGGYKLVNRPVIESKTSQINNTQIAQPSPQTQAKTLGFFKKVADIPVTLEGNPYFLYVGAQFCPFCAAERWSIVKALSNFGSWQNLTGEKSSDGSVVPEAFLNIPTYNFLGATYTSSFITFTHKEIGDRNGKPIPGEELSDFEKQWNDKYNPRGGVPFVFINGQYVQQTSGFSPGLLSGKTYEQVKADLESNANVAYVTAINKEADIITAYLCKATGNQPSNICNDPRITQLVTQVP